MWGRNLCRSTLPFYSVERFGADQLLDKALKSVRELPEHEQEEIARLMLQYAGQDEPEAIDPEHLASVLEGLEQAKRGEFSSDADVAAAFARFGP
jgi:hypothetical protein